MGQPTLDKRNLRTGLVLAGLALALFAGFMLKFLVLK